MDQALLELERVFRADADEILAACTGAGVIHRTRDAAGDPVKQTVREVLRRKLPTAYYVGHGRVVDEQLATGSPMDVIVANNAGAPILVRTANETEYFPYESVYAIGEVKTSYRRSEKPVHAFVDRLAAFQATLSREETQPYGLVPDFTREPYGNPLFAFMLFASAGDFDVDDVRELYRGKNAAELPNVVCFLDRGVLVSVNVYHGAVPGTMPKTHEKGHWEFRWSFTAGAPGIERACSFGMLYFTLVTHLSKCALRPPNLPMYLKGVFGSVVSSILL